MVPVLLVWNTRFERTRKSEVQSFHSRNLNNLDVELVGWFVGSSMDGNVCVSIRLNSTNRIETRVFFCCCCCCFFAVSQIFVFFHSFFLSLSWSFFLLESFRPLLQLSNSFFSIFLMPPNMTNPEKEARTLFLLLLFSGCWNMVWYMTLALGTQSSTSFLSLLLCCVRVNGKMISFHFHLYRNYSTWPSNQVEANSLLGRFGGGNSFDSLQHGPWAAPAWTVLEERGASIEQSRFGENSSTLWHRCPTNHTEDIIHPLPVGGHEQQQQHGHQFADIPLALDERILPVQTDFVQVQWEILFAAGRGKSPFIRFKCCPNRFVPLECVCVRSITTNLIIIIMTKISGATSSGTQ